MILVIGAFPPPVTGAAVINGAFVDYLAGGNIDHRVYDLGSTPVGATLPQRLRRLARFIASITRFAVALANKRGSGAVYVGVAGGVGQMHNLLVAAAARIFGWSLVFHHHSFAYLDNRSRLAAALLQAGGQSALHIVLCPRMASLLVSQYRARPCRVISNAAFVAEAKSHMRDAPDLTIGFLGNISEQKGVFVYLSLCAELKRRGIKVRGLLAGPFQDSQTESKVRAHLAAAGELEYVGPVFAEEKEVFWRSVDVLAFPSRYVHEAEPLVVLEALAHGIPVISSRRGCLEEILQTGDGGALAEADAYVREAVEIIAAWTESRQTYQSCARRARQRFMEMKGAAALALESVVGQWAS